MSSVALLCNAKNTSNDQKMINFRLNAKSLNQFNTFTLHQFENKMNKIQKYIFFAALCLLLQGCGAYSFSGISISPETQTYQVDGFQNTAALVRPGLDRQFTVALQDLILNQTNLSLVNSGGDLIYEGEITQYYIAPNTSTANNTAAQNRLTIGVTVRFYDAKDDTQDLEQTFSFFEDYPASQSLTGPAETAAHERIFERITQDIFNATLARW